MNLEQRQLADANPSEAFQIEVKMMTSKLIRYVLLSILLMPLAPAHAAHGQLFQPADYIHAKLQQNDIVFLGTRHKRLKILRFIADLIPSLKGVGVTHIGLEIPSDQQERIDNYMQTGSDLNSILLHRQIDTPEYRNLFKVLRDSGAPVPVAIDLPYKRQGGSISRDEWMSRSLLELLPGKILVVVGNLHILKKLEWKDQVPNKHLSVRQYIQQAMPSTRMWSVGQLIDQDPDTCDFTQVLGQAPGTVAVDLDEMVRGWKLGFTATMAILPAEPFELVDGVIVY